MFYFCCCFLSINKMEYKKNKTIEKSNWTKKIEKITAIASKSGLGLQTTTLEYEKKKMERMEWIMGKRNQEAMSQMNAWINGEFRGRWKGVVSQTLMPTKVRTSATENLVGTIENNVSRNAQWNYHLRIYRVVVAETSLCPTQIWTARPVCQQRRRCTHIVSITSCMYTNDDVCVSFGRFVVHGRRGVNEPPPPTKHINIQYTTSSFVCVLLFALQSFKNVFFVISPIFPPIELFIKAYTT